MKAIAKVLPIAVVVAGLALPCMADDYVVADIQFDVMTLGLSGLNVFQMEMRPDGSLHGWDGLSGHYTMTMVGTELAGLTIQAGDHPAVGFGFAVAWFENGQWHLVGYGMRYRIVGLGGKLTDIYIFAGEESPIQSE